jgi:hypothetical protein
MRIGAREDCSESAQRHFLWYANRSRIRKGQLTGITQGDVLAQNRVMAQVCGLVAEIVYGRDALVFSQFVQHNCHVPRWGPHEA